MVLVVIAVAILLALLALWVLAWVITPGCPHCGSKRTECYGEWDGFSFCRCRRCSRTFEVYYKPS